MIFVGFLLGVVAGVIFKKYILNAAEKALEEVLEQQKQKNAELNKFNNELIEKVDDLQDQLHFKNADYEFVNKQLEVSKREKVRLKQELEKATCDCDKSSNKKEEVKPAQEKKDKPSTKRRGRPRKKNNDKSK